MKALQLFRTFVPACAGWYGIAATLGILACGGCQLADWDEANTPSAESRAVDPTTTQRRRMIDPRDKTPPDADSPSDHHRSDSEDGSTQGAAEIERLLVVTARTPAAGGGTTLQQADGWHLAVGPNDGRAGRAYRWQHDGLDEILARPVDRRPDLRKVLDSDNPIVVATARIGLARLGVGRQNGPLAEIVRTPSYSLSLRRAAVETLSQIVDPSPVPLLTELVDQYGRPTGGSYVPQLHSELLRGIARHVPPHEDERFVKALGSPAADVRIAALQLWAEDVAGPLPREAVDLLTDPDAQVRIAAIHAVAERRHAAALDDVCRAVADYDLSVKLAAIEALGRFPTEKAHRTLLGLLRDKPDRIREAAVAALGRWGDAKTARAMAEDRSWRVRRAAAAALATNPGSPSAAVAKRLLRDQSGEVRLAMVRALAEWPPEEAGPLLLFALGADDPRTRDAGKDVLKEFWSPAADFPENAPETRRAEALAELAKNWREKFGAPSRPEVEQTGAAITDAEPAPRNSAEQLDLVARLRSGDPAERRSAAASLEKLAKAAGLAPPTVRRLAEVAVTESDPLVWQHLLSAVADDGSEPARRLAYAAISHPAAQVRRAACDYLEANPAPEHAEILLAALEDRDPSVVKAAARALGFTQTTVPLDRLEALLASGDGTLRVEAAAALARLGRSSGPAALERLSYHSDEQVRRLTAVAMGSLADPGYTATLIRLLDDQSSVRRAALEALPKAVGKDVTAGQDPPAESPAEKARLWKAWYEKHPDGTP